MSWRCASLAMRALRQRSLKMCREHDQAFVFEGKEKQGNHVVASCQIRVARVGQNALWCHTFRTIIKIITHILVESYVRFQHILAVPSFQRFQLGSRAIHPLCAKVDSKADSFLVAQITGGYSRVPTYLIPFQQTLGVCWGPNIAQHCPWYPPPVGRLLVRILSRMSS